MEIIKNIAIESSVPGKPILADVFYKNNQAKKPVIIFCHGFKGFKDWGGWNLVARQFAEKGYIFIKFNFSHNGTTPDNPTVFDDLEAFGRNTFTQELSDLDTVIDWMLQTPLIPEHHINGGDMCLVGHSRGGATAILKAAEDMRIRKLATWAAVNNLARAWDENVVSRWKNDGVIFVENSRTRQHMPLYYTLYEDLQDNKDRLDIEKAVKSLQIPYLIIHGTEDASVPFEQALELKRWDRLAKLDLIPQASHTFGMRHPFDDLQLPFDMQVVVQHTDEFFQQA